MAINFVSGKKYRFVSCAYLGKALNIYGSGVNGIVSGRNICLFDDDDTDLMQEWMFKTSNGDMYLCNSTRQSFVLDRSSGVTGSPVNNAHICSTSMTSKEDYSIILEPYGGNKYIISLKNGALCLTAMNGSTPEAGTISSLGAAGNVCWKVRDGSTKQIWIVKEIEEGQKLIHPFDKQYYTVGYEDEAPAYPAKYPIYGYHHAVDMFASGDTSVYASGNGEIVGTKTFNSLGKVLAVRYDNVLNRKGKNIGSIIVRYCHLDSFSKTSGTITKGDKIAVEGATGSGAGNGKTVHLHMEFDTDVNYPLMTPTEGGGTNTTINPLEVLYKSSNQTVEPDSVLPGKYDVDENGLAWYDREKIEDTPIA